jgi:hypothetical protein
MSKLGDDSYDESWSVVQQVGRGDVFIEKCEYCFAKGIRKGEQKNRFSTLQDNYDQWDYKWISKIGNIVDLVLTVSWKIVKTQTQALYNSFVC